MSNPFVPFVGVVSGEHRAGHNANLLSYRQAEPQGQHLEIYFFSEFS